MQFGQKARTRYMVKNGSQQNIKPPTIIAKVLAALVSIRKRFTWAFMLRLPIRRLITLGLSPSSQELGLGLGARSALSQLLDLQTSTILAQKHCHFLVRAKLF